MAQEVDVPTCSIRLAVSDNFADTVNFVANIETSNDADIQANHRNLPQPGQVSLEQFDCDASSEPTNRMDY